MHRLVHRRRQGRGEADRAARQHGHGHGDEGGAGADASRIGRHRDAGPGPVDDAHGGAEADRQVVGEPRQIGPKPPAMKRLSPYLHVRDVAQADVAERAPARAVHRGDALAPRPEEGQGAGRRTVGRRARRLRERRSARSKARLNAARSSGRAMRRPITQMAVLRRPPQRLASRAAESDQRIDRPRIQPMRAEIDGMPFQGHGHGAPADAVARFEDRDRSPAARSRRAAAMPAAPAPATTTSTSPEGGTRRGLAIGCMRSTRVTSLAVARPGVKLGGFKRMPVG